MDNNSTFLVEWDSDLLFDKVVAAGATLNNSILQVNLTYTPAFGTEITILDNTTVLPVSGVFGGLPEGAQFSAGGSLLEISYAGGTGNDITLAIVPEPGTALLVGLAGVMILNRRRRNHGA